jgi:hypothetical protein
MLLLQLQTQCGTSCTSVCHQEVVCAAHLSCLCPSARAQPQAGQLGVSRQVKAHLRGEAPPLSAQQLDVVLEVANSASRELLGML